MFSIQDIIKYIGLAAIIYFLIKAITNDTLDNKQILILVVLIMIVVIFIVGQSFTCNRREKFQGEILPIVPSVYPNPKSKNDIQGYFNTDDEDIRDFKDIMQIDKQTYEKLINNEKKAMEKIQSMHKNDMANTNTHPFNTIPLGSQLYGYTYLPPENWFRAYEKPPICTTDKKCRIMPMSDASITGLMEFDTINNVKKPTTNIH